MCAGGNDQDIGLCDFRLNVCVIFYNKIKFSRDAFCLGLRLRQPALPSHLQRPAQKQFRGRVERVDDEGGVVARGADPGQGEERVRPEVTETTLTALNQLEDWVRALLVEG